MGTIDGVLDGQDQARATATLRVRLGCSGARGLLRRVGSVVVALAAVPGCGRLFYDPLAALDDAGVDTRLDASGDDAAPADAGSFDAAALDAPAPDAPSLDAASPVDVEGLTAACTAHPGYQLVGIGCFRLVIAAESYADAELVCERDGAHLAVIESLEEQEALHARWPLPMSIGLVDVAGTWTWVTGELPAFEHWDAGEPDTQGSCARMLDTTGRWDARSCMDAQRYLCELDGRAATIPIP